MSDTDTPTPEVAMDAYLGLSDDSVRERLYDAIGTAIPTGDDGVYVMWYDGHQITYDGIDAILAAIERAGFRVVSSS